MKTQLELHSSFTGNHLSGKTNADVRAFHMISTHQHLSRLLTGIEKLFPNLILLAWESGSLTTLTADPKLQVLYAYNNKLVSLDGDLFKHTPNLKRIQFHENQLDSLLARKSLKKLNLIESYRIIGKVFDKGLFRKDV